MSELWQCPKCGPIRGSGLPDEEGKPRCSNDGCDRLLKYTGLGEERPRYKVQAGRPAKFNPPSHEVLAANDREKRRTAEQATREGKAILAAMEARKSATPQRKGNMNAAHKGAEDREGICHLCQKRKWLIRRAPATCAPCWDKISIAKAKGLPPPQPAPVMASYVKAPPQPPPKAPTSPVAASVPPLATQPTPTRPEAAQEAPNVPNDKNRRPSKVTPELRAEIVKLRKGGMGQREIGEKIRPTLTQTTVSRILREEGVEPLEKKTHLGNGRPAPAPEERKKEAERKVVKPKVKATVVTTKPEKPPRGHANGVHLDDSGGPPSDLETELLASAAVARALEGLPDIDSVRRVLFPALDRTKRRLGMEDARPLLPYLTGPVTE